MDSYAYKERNRNTNVKNSNVEMTKAVSIPIVKIHAKDCSSISDACNLLGASRWTVSRAIKEKRLEAVNLHKKMSIRQSFCLF